MPSTNAIKVLYICSDVDKDQKLRDEIEKHLSILREQGVVTTWHKGMIGAGKELENEMYTQLMMADIVLPLISSDFMNSYYQWDVVVKQAMERQQAGAVRVIPILLRLVDNWKSTNFGRLRVLPEGEKPVTDWKPYDKAFVSITQGIREAIKELTDPYLPVKKSCQQISTSVLSIVVNSFVNLVSTTFSSTPTRSRKYSKGKKRKNVAITSLAKPVIFIVITGAFLPQVSNLLDTNLFQPNKILVSTQNLTPIGWIWIGQVNHTSESLPIGKPLLGEISIDPPLVPSPGTIVSVEQRVNLRKNRPQPYSPGSAKWLGILKPGEKLVILKVESLDKPNSNSSNMRIWAQVARCNQTCEQ